MSAATNLGLRSAFGDPRGPSGGVVGWWRETAGRSRPFGVGHIFACTVNDVSAASELPPIRAFIARWASGVLPSSWATGVPHIRTARSVNVPFQPSAIADSPLPLDFASPLVGVGQQPEPFPPVGCANGGRGVQTPLRIEPEDGKVGEDVR
jgi:hypothetical protein